MCARATILGREAGAHPPDEFEMPAEAVEIEAPDLAPGGREAAASTTCTPWTAAGRGPTSW